MQVEQVAQEIIQVHSRIVIFQETLKNTEVYLREAENDLAQLENQFLELNPTVAYVHDGVVVAVITDDRGDHVGIFPTRPCESIAARTRPDATF